MLKSLLFLFASLSLYAETHIMAVRHGETPRNAAGLELQGWIDDADAQLNAHGQAQADEVGRLLAEHYQGQATAIYTSPLGRSLETAKRIAASFTDLPIIEDRRLIEICHGQHDTMPFKTRNVFCIQRYAELEKEFTEQFPGQTPDKYFKWSYNPLVEREIPAARLEQPFDGEIETILQLLERGTAAFKEIAEKHPGEMVLVSSHGGMIKTLADEAEYRQKGDKGALPPYFEPKAPAAPGTRQIPSNCSVFHFVWDNDELSLIGIENLLKIPAK